MKGLVSCQVAQAYAGLSLFRDIFFESLGNTDFSSFTGIFCPPEAAKIAGWAFIGEFISKNSRKQL